MRNSESFKVTTPTDREIVISRVFDAPRVLVHDALEALLLPEAAAGEPRPSAS